MDETGERNFMEAIKSLKTDNKKIILSGVQPNVRKSLDKCRISFLIGKGNIHDNFDAALAHAKEALEEENPLQIISNHLFVLHDLPNRWGRFLSFSSVITDAAGLD